MTPVIITELGTTYASAGADADLCTNASRHVGLAVPLGGLVDSEPMRTMLSGSGTSRPP